MINRSTTGIEWSREDQRPFLRPRVFQSCAQNVARLAHLGFLDQAADVDSAVFHGTHAEISGVDEMQVDARGIVAQKMGLESKRAALARLASRCIDDHGRVELLPVRFWHERRALRFGGAYQAAVECPPAEAECRRVHRKVEKLPGSRVNARQIHSRRRIKQPAASQFVQNRRDFGGKKLAAHFVPRKLGLLEKHDARAGARQFNRRRAAGGSRANYRDVVGVHRISETSDNRNGTWRRTRTCERPARLASASSSAAVKACCTETSPSARLTGENSGA